MWIRSLTNRHSFHCIDILISFPPPPLFFFLFSVNLLTWVDHLLRTEAAIGRRPSWNGHLLLFVSWVDINSKSMATTWYVRKLQLDNLLKAIGKVKVTVAWILEFTNESALLAHLTRLYPSAYFRYLGEKTCLLKRKFNVSYGHSF